ncbi:NAD-dependent epimerase/dehydratase family protein [Legionella lytica]|uniref:NAD-dependent epimerase/dehydratase family protein n=1 Tax=Legionella lytica TaxID=96232 RepID=A0ABW8DA65_9GAMM
MVSVVTGATGCLGLNLTQRLLKQGVEVIALGRNEALGKILTQAGARFIQVDLQDQTKLKQVIPQETQTLFHCAALSSPWGRYADFYAANVLGTQHVIECTAETTRLVHVSSPSIYFDFSERHNIKEQEPLPEKPANHYVKTKLMAEALVDKAYKEKQRNVITLRPRALFGPYDRAIFPRLLQSERKGVLPIIGSGQNLIDITYVENVVESLILAAQADAQFCGNKYNITNGEPQTLIQILKQLFDALQKPLKLKFIPYTLAKNYAACLEKIHRLPLVHSEPRLTKYSAGVLSLGQTLNIDAAQNDLGYQPLFSISQGIKRFAKWYQHHD